MNLCYLFKRFQERYYSFLILKNIDFRIQIISLTFRLCIYKFPIRVSKMVNSMYIYLKLQLEIKGLLLVFFPEKHKELIIYIKEGN